METLWHFLIVGLAVTALAGNASAADGTELLYVANSQGDDLTIVRLPDHQPLGSVQVGAHPHGLAASRDGRWLYVSVESSKEILVLDTASNQIVWRVPVSDCPNQIALSGDGHHLFVPIRLADYVEVIDTQQRRSIGKIKVGRSPHNTLTSADGRHIYATSMDDHRVTIIDAASLAVLGTIPCGGIVRPIDVTRDETRMYAALSDLHGFVVADIPSRKIVERVLLPPVPEGAEPLVPQTPTHGLGLTPDDRLLVVTSVVGNYVGLFAVPGNRLLGTVTTGKAPNWVTFRHDGQVCYVSNAGSDDVSVVDLAARKEVARIPVGKMPKRLVTIVVPERRSSAPPNKRSYSTRFQLDEDPISEGGKWINGGKDGIDWFNVITKNGVAYGAVTQGEYTDPTALLTGHMGQEPEGQSQGVQQEPDGEVLPGGRDPSSQQDRAAPLHRVRGLLAVPEDPQRLRRNRQVERQGPRLDLAEEAHWGSVRGQGRGSRRGDDHRQRHQGVRQRRRGRSPSRTTRSRRAVRGWGSTTASAKPTATSGSRRTRYRATMSDGENTCHEAFAKTDLSQMS